MCGWIVAIVFGTIVVTLYCRLFLPTGRVYMGVFNGTDRPRE